MASISRDILREFVQKGFFDQEKSVDQVVEKLENRGFSIKKDKKGLVGQLLTKLCQEGLLERKKDSEGNWRYFKNG